VYYQSYAMDMTRQFITDLGAWARHYQVAASEVEEVVLRDPDKDILAYQIRFDSGRFAQALSSSPRQLRSKGAPGDVAILDEFAFVDDQEALLKASLAFLMWGGSVRIISTHNGVDNPFNQLVEDIRAKKRPYSLHETTFDGAIAGGLARRIFLRMGREWTPEAEAEWRKMIIDSYGEDAEEELFCVPSQGEGKYFTRTMVKNCMAEDIPVVTWSMPSDWEHAPDDARKRICDEWCRDHLKPLLDGLDPERTHWFGEDFARNRNLTVIWPGAEMPDTRIKVPFAVELFDIPFRQQEQVLFYLCDRLPRFAGGAMDARGNGQALAEFAMQRYGEQRIHRIMLSDKWYGQYFPIYKDAIASREMLLPQSADVLDDHRAVERVKGIPKIVEETAAHRKGERKRKLKRHGDSAIAGVMLRYAVEEIGNYIPLAYGSTDPEPTRRAADAPPKSGRPSLRQGPGPKMRDVLRERVWGGMR
jgi:phage FluMu gp28-like protein